MIFLKIHLLSLALLISLSLFSQDHFEKHFSNPDGLFSYSICRAGEEGFILGVGNWAETWGMIKVDVHGEIIWAQQLMMESILPLPYFDNINEDNILVVQYSAVGNASALRVIKMNTQGEFLWANDYMRVYHYGVSSIQTPEGNIYIATSGTRVNVLKLSDTGEWLWTRRISGGDDGTIHGYDDQATIIETSDNNLLVVGSTRDGDILENNAFIFEMDPNGNVIWARILGGDGIDQFRSVAQTEDLGFIAVGFTESMGRGGQDYFAVKFDSAGNIAWAKTYGTYESESCYNIVGLDGGDFLLSGRYGNSPGHRKGHLAKIDGNGNLIWSVGTINEISFRDVAEADMNKIAITGSCLDSLEVYHSILVMTDSSGLLCESVPYDLEVVNVQPEVSTWFSNNDFMDTTVQVSVLTETLNVQVSTACIATSQNEIPPANGQELNIVPNPFHTSAMITFPGSHSGPYEVLIFNSSGALIHSVQNIRSDSFEIDRDNLLSGLYFIQVRNMKRIVVSGKVIVM